jgi:hypothetical protein
LLLGALAYALARKRHDVVLFALPAFALLAFNALLTIFVPRYAVMAVPSAMVAAAYVVLSLWRSASVAPLRSRVLGAISKWRSLRTAA